MGASRIALATSIEASCLPERLPRIRLHHSEAVRVMAQLGFQGAAGKATFYEYIKSLRKLGIPFDRGKIGIQRRGRANYSYCHLMELALALTTRVYYFVPDTVLNGIVRHRHVLYRYYRRAYADRNSGIGAQITVSVPHLAPITVRGVFLDLRIDFSGGILTRFGPAILLPPYQALATFADRDVAARALLPINLSLLAERMASIALRSHHSN